MNSQHESRAAILRGTVDLVTFDHDIQVCQSVQGFVIGPLAVHRELDNDYNQWAVSHVRTDYRVKGGIKSKGIISPSEQFG